MSDSEPGSPPPLPPPFLPPAPDVAASPECTPIAAEPPPVFSGEKPPPVESPPLLPCILPLPSPPSPPDPPRAGPLLVTAVVVVGVLQLVLAIIAPSGRGTDASAPYRFGEVLGATLITPAVVMALFSIGRRFRTTRWRAFILLAVWGLASFTAIERLARARQQTAMRQFLDHVGKSGFQAAEESAAPASRTSGDDDVEAEVEPLSAEAAAAEVRAHDFSTGSDHRLITLIEHAHETEYHSVVAGYARACAARSRDAVLALERVRFIAHFVYAEDVTIASASDDHDAALDHLTRHFPDAPGTVLYQLENCSDEEFEAEARPHARRVPRWSGAERAKYFLLRARVANRNDAAEQVRRFARDSFTAEATTEAGLLLARALETAERNPEALEILLDPVFEGADPWEKKQKMDLLFDLSEPALALVLYDELQETLPHALGNTAMALRLARAGKVDAARARFATIAVNDWNRDDIQRARFRFEMEFGTAEHALQAYRERRAAGIMTDPLLRDRLTLFWKYPGLGWNLDDLGGVVLLALALATAFASPLLVLVPVHYWSLLRARRGRPAAWPEARWGLRAAWIAFGVLAVAEVVALWLFAPEWVRALLAEVDADAAEAQRILPMQTFVWLMGGVVLAILWWRARAGRLLGPGAWGIWKAVGVGCGIMFLLRLGLRMYVLFWPGAVGADFAASGPVALQLNRELLQQVGAPGLLLVVGGFVPLIEEMLFRGVLLQALAKHIPFGWANFIQAAGFAALHDNLALLPFFTAFGLACGWLARRAGGLLPCIVLHASNNLIACFALLRLRGVVDWA